MDADRYIGRWIVIIHDQPHEAAAQPWKQGLPLGGTFEISKDTFGSYWYLPSPELRAPMNQPRKFAISKEKHGEFDVGKLMDGTLCADFGDKVGMLYFALNLIGQQRRIMSLSQSHGGIHLVDF